MTHTLLQDENSRNYILIIKQVSYPSPCTISTSTNSDYVKFAQYISFVPFSHF